MVTLWTSEVGDLSLNVKTFYVFYSFMHVHKLRLSLSLLNFYKNSVLFYFVTLYIAFLPKGMQSLLLAISSCFCQWNVPDLLPSPKKVLIAWSGWVIKAVLECLCQVLKLESWEFKKRRATILLLVRSHKIKPFKVVCLTVSITF